jgi:hypothetical protein
VNRRAFNGRVGQSGKNQFDFFPSFPVFLLPVAWAVSLSGCGTRAVQPSAPSPPAGGTVLAADALVPSPRLIVGRIIAVDPVRRFAFVELASDAPSAALAEGTELIARTADLRETARLSTSRHLRGRTLGTNVVGGQPSPDDEVVWLAP